MPKRDLHGTFSYYNNHKCRCEKCKMANRDHMRAYRAGKKAKNAKQNLQSA